MPFAVELYMDGLAASAVRTIWQSLVDAGVPSLPLALGAKPHISLCVYESLDSSRLASELQSFANQMRAIPFALEAVETFAALNGVVFLAPWSNSELTQIHSRFQSEFDSYRETASPYYLPNNLEPHCTVAENLSAEQVDQAVEICRKGPLPIQGYFTQVGLVEFRPIGTNLFI